MKSAKWNRDQSSRTRSNRWFMAITAATILLLLPVSYLGYIRWRTSQQILTPKIKKQLTFASFWPDKTASVTINKQTIEYDSKDKLLTFKARAQDGTSLTVSEQATPEGFTDIPQAYTKLIQTLFQYGSFDSLNGTVYLTHPKELKGGQAAVMNSKGTLMFVRPDKDLSDDTWHQLFNNLQILQ